jgi:SOS-response transcriptional repressor LexA
MISLTPRMRDLLLFIQTQELCPSHKEMRAALGITGCGPIDQLLRGLEERGYIRRLKARARAIEVLRPLQTTVFIHGQRYRFIPFPKRRGS